MVAGVGETVDSDRRHKDSSLQLRLLGPMTVSRGGAALALPTSRKVRALIAYLALAPHPVTRSQLCELLWDVPNDPRGELRWCLSKVRSIVNEPGRRRVGTQGDAVSLDLTDCFVDAIEIAQATQHHIETLEAERLRGLLALFSGDFLDGLEIDRSPVFHGWLTAQRRRFRGCHVALLEHLVRRLPDGDEVFGHLDKWLQLAPFDRRAHEILLNALARRGRIREARRASGGDGRAVRGRRSRARRNSRRVEGRQGTSRDVRRVSKRLLRRRQLRRAASLAASFRPGLAALPSR